MTRGDFLLVGILIGMGVLFNVASGSPAVVTSAGATGDKKHDILLISCWQKSSIINTQGIAEALAERGHRVRVVTPTEEQRYVTTHPRVQFVDGGAGPAADDPQYAISALTPDGGNWKKAHTIFHIWQGVGIYGLAMFRHLLDTLRADPPELILYDVLALAGPALARSLNITSVAVAPHITSFVRWGHFDWTVPTIISGHSRTTMNSLSSRLANGAQALLLNHVLPLLRAQIQRPYYQALGLPLDFADHQMLILGNSLATEYPSALPAHVFRVGPFLPRSFASPLPPALLQWIESPSSAASSSALPIIYLAIGTNSYWTPALVNAFIAEFEQHAGHAYRVIWTFDPQRVESGGAQFASYFEQVATSPAVKVIDYVNQFALLGHPQVKLFITHCGLGSIHEALYQGTPMVCMPTMLESDQPTNAARLAELGLASWIDRRGGEPSAHHLHHVLLHALTTSSSWPTLQYQQYVRSLGGVARAADLVEQALDLHLPSLLFQ